MLLQNRRTQERAARHVAPMITCALALAAVVAVARPAAAQGSCGGNPGEGGPILCGTVWNDLNGNGIQELGEPGLGGKTVTVFDADGMEVTFFLTNPDGTYYFDGSSLQPGNTYSITVDISSIGTGVQASPNGNGTEQTNSDGVDNTMGLSVAEVIISDCCTQHADIDFGFHTAVASQPGTGTPGYWKNHPTAWPSPYQSGITIGGVTYTKTQAIAILSKPGKDKRATMFSSLLSAMLNVAFVGSDGSHNDDSCVASTITAANTWMATWGVPNTDPIVPGGSAAWADGEPLHKLMDAYNNGLLCAPHRN